ncbi:MAG: (2Fe-2S)-binding protein [Pseudobacteriovorax sp.]|nr:(2Fe-2S)-binding protein [Pseudobacteriovorax sp.]
MKQYVNINFDEDSDHPPIKIRKGLSLIACRELRSKIEFDCAKADCGICIFRLLEGKENLSEASGAEKDFLQAMRADESERLACQSKIYGDITIAIDDFSP